MALLEVEDLRLSFGGLRAVDGVSFDVEPSEIFSIIGPNGAGKTTLLNLVSRIHEPSGGRIVVGGREITRIPAHDVAHAGVARTFQNLALLESATVEENLMLGRYRHARSRLWQQALYTPSVRRECAVDRARVEAVIELLGLARVRREPAGSLPYGVRKMVELGRALAAEPRLLLLDEPGAGLGAEEKLRVVGSIKEVRDGLGVTVVLIEHDMSLVAALSDRVMAMSSGRVLALGPAAAVQGDPAVEAAYLGA